MKEKTDQFLINQVEILEEFLEYLWKSPVTIKEKIVYTQEKLFTMDFVISNNEIIRLHAKVEKIVDEYIIRLNYTSYYEQNFKNPIACLLLSFCYQCPDELELCNQYGLYKKEDINQIEQLQDADLIHKYQNEKNMLGENKIFIFNMRRIKEHCKDKVLDQILQDFNKAIRNCYYKEP